MAMLGTCIVRFAFSLGQRRSQVPDEDAKQSMRICLLWTFDLNQLAGSINVSLKFADFLKLKQAFQKSL